MAINFPHNPNPNDIHTEASLGKSWKWDGTTWLIYSSSTTGIAFGDLSVSQQAASGGGSLTYNNAGLFTYTPPAGGGGGSSTFIGLNDTPGSLTAGKWLKVNTGGTALEWTDAPASNDTNDYVSSASLSGNTLTLGRTGSQSLANITVDLSSLNSVPTNITVVNESTDTECYPLFTTEATGNLAPKTVTSFKLNSSSGQLEAGSFKKTGGTSSEFLKADGSVDSNTYLSSAPSYALNDLSDVDATTGAANGKILKYNGTSWELADDQSGLTSEADTLQTVTARGATSDQVIELSGGSGGTALHLKSGGDLRLWNAADSGNVELYCDDDNSLKINGGIGHLPGGLTTSGLIKGGTTATGVIFSVGDSGTSGDKLIQIKRASTTTDCNIQAVVAGTGAGTLKLNDDGGTVTTGGSLQPSGGIIDKDGDLGNSGQILSSTGTQLNWIDAGGGGATTINNNADNRIITGSATVNSLNAESSLQYDGNSLFFSDDKAIKFGNNLRMQMYTDGSINYIKSATDGGGAFPIQIHSGSSEVINIDDGNTQIKTGLKDKDGDLGTAGQVLSSTGTQVNWIDATGGGSYSNSDVDTHLNQSNPTNGYVLSWNGSDYAWVAQTTDTNTTYSLFTTSADGLAPTLPAAHGGKFLKADGSWEVPAYTTNTDTQLTTEQVQDIVGGMVDGGTETRIGVTYDDTSGKLNFVVDDQSSDNNTTYDLSGVATSNGFKTRLTGSDSTEDDVEFTPGGGISYTVTGNTCQISSINTISGLSDTSITGSPTNGYVLAYDTGDSKWKPVAPSGGADGNDYVTNLSLSGTTLTAEFSNTSLNQTINLASIDTNTNTTYSVSCVDGDNADEEKIRLTAGGSGSGTDDVVLEAGTGLTIARDGDKITFTNSETDTKYDLTGVATGSGFKVRLAGDTASGNTNDDVEFTPGGGISYTVSGNTCQISSVNSLSGLSDTNITSSPNPGDALVYQNNQWEAGTAGGAGDIPSGSVMLFYQTSAPTGWTKSTSHNNKALRVVSGNGGGSGGSVGFTSAFANHTVSISDSDTVSISDSDTVSISGNCGGSQSIYWNTTQAFLTVDQMPSHQHDYDVPRGTTGASYGFQDTATGTSSGLQKVASTGGSNYHTHAIIMQYVTGSNFSFSGSDTVNISGSDTVNISGSDNVNAAVQYLDVIICSKN